MAEPVLYREDHDAVTLTLNRPHRLNALNDELLAALANRLDSIAATTRVVTLKGAGRAFSSGYDLKDAASPGTGRTATERERHSVEKTQAVTRAVRRCPVPVIALVHGYAIGGGAEIAFSCDLVIASRDATFQFPETALGLSVTNGMSYLLPAVAGPAVAKELVLLGERFGAERAREHGLVNRVVDADRLDEEAGRVANALSERPQGAIRAAKRMLDRGIDGRLEDAFVAEIEGAAELALSEDAVEAKRAFAEGRRPKFSA